MTYTDNDFIRFKKERYEQWFNTFLENTDEKRHMNFIFQQLAKSLYENKLSKCQVLDIGCGEGTLAKCIAENLIEYCKKLDYYGIDSSEVYVRKTNQTLKKLPILNDVKIYQGNFSKQQDLANLPNHTDIIIASHVAYYVNNITEFVVKLVNKAKPSTALVFFHQSNVSIISEFRRNYSLDVSASPQKAIKESLESQGYTVLELLYPALIRVPQCDELKIEDVVSDYGIPHESFSNLRYLLEFIVHAPLEYLENNQFLAQYAGTIKQILAQQNNILIFWDVMQIATKYNISNSSSFTRSLENKATNVTKEQYIESETVLIDSELKSKMEALAISRLTPLEMACYEGNMQVVLRLKSHIATHYNAIDPFMGLVLAAKQGHFKIVQILLEEINFFNIDQKLDQHFKDKGFNALHMATKHGYYEIVEILLKANATIGEIGGAENITALYLAEQKCHPKVRNLLIKYGTNDSYGHINPSTKCSFPLEHYIDIDNVIGRKEVINEIESKLEAKGSVIVISGNPGIGKTTLAKTIGINQSTRHSTKESRYTVEVFNIEDTDLIDKIKKFARPIIGAQYIEQHPTIMIPFLYSQLKTQENFLFILDNAEKCEDVEWFIKDIPKNVDIIITTRDSEFSNGIKYKFYTVQLQLFSRDEVHTYISKHLQNIDSELKEVIIKSVNNPGQLELVVSHLKTHHSIDYQEFTTHIESGDVSQFIFKELQKSNHEAWRLLTYLAYLNPDFIPLDVLESHFKSLYILISVLQQRSMVFIVMKDGVGLRIHREIQIGVRKCVQNNEDILANLAKTLDKKMPLYFPYESKKNRDLSRKYTATLASFLQHIHDVNTEEVASLYNKLGRVKVSLTFNHTGGHDAYSQALEIYKRYGENSCEIAFTYTNIGELYYWEEHFKEAIENLKKAEEIYQVTKCPAEEQKSTYWNMNWCYFLNKDYEHALLSLNKTLEVSHSGGWIYGLQALIYFKLEKWFDVLSNFIAFLWLSREIFLYIIYDSYKPEKWFDVLSNFTTFLWSRSEISLYSLDYNYSSTSSIIPPFLAGIFLYFSNVYPFMAFEVVCIGVLIEYFKNDTHKKIINMFDYVAPWYFDKLYNNIDKKIQALNLLNIWSNEVLDYNTSIISYISYNIKALQEWQNIVDKDHIFVTHSKNRVLLGIEKLLNETNQITNNEEIIILKEAFNSVAHLTNLDQDDKNKLASLNHSLCIKSLQESCSESIDPFYARAMSQEYNTDDLSIIRGL